MAKLSLNSLMTKRTLYLTGEINDEMMREFIKHFTFLDTSKGLIRVVVNSPGGDTPSGFMAFDTMTHSKNKVVTEAFGEASSIAALIFCGGDVRLVAPMTTMFLHNTFAEVGGSEGGTKSRLTPRYLHARAKELEVYQEMYNRAVADRTGLDEDVIAALCNKDTLLAPQGMIANGIAHDFIQFREERIKELLCI